MSRHGFSVFVAVVLIDAGSARAEIVRRFDGSQHGLRAPMLAATQPKQTMPGTAAASAPRKPALSSDPVPVDGDPTGHPHGTTPDIALESRPQDPASPGGTRYAWRGYFGVEGRIFNHPPAISGQVRHGLALVAQPEFSYASENRRHRVHATFFGRFSVEPRYGSADVRELFWQYRQDRWSLLAGINRVFWGATESRHAIDIVNQADMRENYIGDVKLGQLMVAVSLQRAWGQLELYALPLFRPRAFPVDEDRPRLQLPVSDAETVDGPPLDAAARVSISRGDVDVHAYYFRGVNREPNLIPVFDRPGAAPTALKPIYRRIDQFGGDLQYARGPWVFKGEMLHRSTPDAQYQSGVGGLEYGITRLFGSASDLTLLSEYQFDNRPDTEWPAPATRGIYAGMRLALNDTGSSEAKAGVVHDLSSHSWLIRADFTRRLSDQWGLSLEYSGFGHVGRSRALRDFYRDSYTTLTLRRYL